MKKAYSCVLMVCMVVVGLSFHAIAEEQDENGTHRFQTISEDQYREAFLDYLYKATENDPADMVLSRFKVNHNQPVTDGEVSFQVFQKSRGALRGNVRLVVIVYVNGVSENEVRLTGWVDEFAPVVCTTRHIKRGEVIQKADIFLSKKNITRQSEDLLTDTRDAIGRLAKSSIKQDAGIKGWMLEEAPVLDKGDPVTILAQLGRIRITVPGIILEKGYSGERVRVQNTMSRKEIYARVVDNSTVTIDF